MLAAKVMPVGLPAHAERYQPSTITSPIALPVTGQRHLPCSGSSGRFADEPHPQRDDEGPDDRPRRKAPAPRGESPADRRSRTRRPGASSGRAAARRRSPRSPRSRIPAGRPRRRARPRPGGTRSCPAQPPLEDHAHAEDEAAGEVGEPPERPDRDRFDQAELEHVDADDRDHEREHVSAQDRRVAHEGPVGERPREAEAAALRAVAEEQPGEERAAAHEEARDLHGRDLSRGTRASAWPSRPAIDAR